ncbi:RepA2 protein (plasmid) [Buchnera aphidicola str. Bp (Baizongia pistaciae)]|uniref:Probable replication-associated protein repA2 n=1 Tax=Buchnera aphidicola subsp. Baizongia pistaciae (strain Bp) TaxID=224915 RepID=REPA2_BUCBP|nr:replication-associated protein repA2 [Buchnera aphidicola]Q89B47.1 RecName: Full=Probable replication-associated protein repA2 [Buchnera aphidicola str. Bp (Baizongia pistaciae)]AAO31544.1 RepA2 protein [Buchnera aphidicola str. Bp (Baizongia pistaciae)]
MLNIKTKKKNKKRIYVFNKNPEFKFKHLVFQKNKFILKIINEIDKIDLMRSEIFNSTLPIDPQTGNILVRFRKLNRNRLLAIKAIIQAMLYHFNIKTKKVTASVEQLADECGLSTVSKSGNKSITRASRLISQFMEPMGFIKCKKIKTTNNKFSKEIILTPLFFMILVKNSSLSEGDTHLKQEFKILKNKNVHINSSETFAKQEILKKIINKYSLNKLKKLGPKKIKEKINTEYKNIKK